MDIPFLGFIAQVRNTDRKAVYCWACAPRLWHEELQDAYGNVVQPIIEERVGDVCSLCSNPLGEDHLFADLPLKTQTGRIKCAKPRMQNLPYKNPAS